MKTSIKTIVAYATCLCAFSSCTQMASDSRENSRALSGEILFGCSGISVESKSFTETKNSSLYDNGFNVAAVFDKDNETMFNSHVSYVSEISSFKPDGGTYYFPEDGTMSFYCVYPVSNTIDIDDGAASISYMQNPDVDMVVSCANGVRKTIAPVYLSFEHILSQVLINCKGNDMNADYLLKSIKISAASKGRYLFAEDKWECGQCSDYVFFASEKGKTLVSYTFRPCDNDMSFIPGDVSVNVVWTTYNKGTDTVIGEYDQTVNVNLQRGVRTFLNLTLPNDRGNEILFDIYVKPWKEKSQNIVVEEPGRVVTVPASDNHLVQTGNTMDLGLKDGSETFTYFFQVRVKDGEHVGESAYTRNGRFHINADRMLADENGNVLQPEICIPEGAARINVSENGHVESFDDADKKISEADIILFTFLGGVETMQKIGERLYQPVLYNGTKEIVTGSPFGMEPGFYAAPFVEQGFWNESDDGYHAQNGRMDVYIDGEGFFQVELSGKLAYTKEGDFILNEDGTLIDRNGCIVQPEFAVPVETMRVVISPDGHIAALDSDGVEIAGAEIPLYYFYNEDALAQRMQNGRHYYFPTESSGYEVEGVPGESYSDANVENGVLGTLVQGKYLVDTTKPKN